MPSVYMSELGFSTSMRLKAKARQRLNRAPDMPVPLSAGTADWEEIL